MTGATQVERMTDPLVPLTPISEHRADDEEPKAIEAEDRGRKRSRSKGTAYAVIVVVGLLAGVLLESNPAVGVALTVIATGVMAYFTMALFEATDEMRKTAGAQLSAMQGQLSAMERQATQLDLEFNATHRPRLVLRYLMFDLVTAENPDDDPRFRIELANVGDSEAIVSNVTIRLFPLSGDYADLEARIATDLDVRSLKAMIDQHIPNGDSWAFYMKDGRVADAIAMEAGANDRGRFMLYCTGYVEYTDKAGLNRRRTGFIRQTRLTTRRFVRAEQSLRENFDYED